MVAEIQRQLKSALSHSARGIITTVESEKLVRQVANRYLRGTIDVTFKLPRPPEGSAYITAELEPWPDWGRGTPLRAGEFA